MMSTPPLKIGISSRLLHPEKGVKGHYGRTRAYLEESAAHWVMSRNSLAFMIPTVSTPRSAHRSAVRIRDFAAHLDALVLQSGSDVSPLTYGETALKPEWEGDRIRDLYELELLHEFMRVGKPVLGICRGCQLINVAFGGTLHQDIATFLPEAGLHVSDDYEDLHHAIQFPPGSSLAAMYPQAQDRQAEWKVNSIHHQAIKDLGKGLRIEAVSSADHVIEAIRLEGEPFVMGLQWHPEFHHSAGDALLDCTPILDEFLHHARQAVQDREPAFAAV
ncbi:gamma-glutamyl-gamma-aminobutyrate hydrolase family protein [Roseateles sp. DB2]|uniref:gamma-glutamyl-gamma-aminobutyrate hydrolase family protein n=1 Tax=Roseateles sp. DB2 TaxID=3453717 RepID=UPI003EE885E8